MARQFSAPWSTSVRVVTAATLLLCIGVGVTAGAVGAAVCAAVVVLGAAFAVRGYSVEDGYLLIHRPGWTTRLPLARLRAAEVAPGAMAGSIRTFGIGGLFASVGHFRNAALGAYRAYATDSARAVVLRFEGGPVVVTPDRPADFVAALGAPAVA